MSILQEQIKKLPNKPGVYFFLGPKKEILYIGKATSLRSRVRSYFADDIILKRSRLISEMVEKAVAVDHTVTDSVLEALILEAYLIKQHNPKHNTLGLDDKSFNHVVITNEDLPRVLMVRGHDVNKRYGKKDIKYIYGPFPKGVLFKEALRLIRKIFPFYDTKKPVQEILKGMSKKKLEFNQQIGLYPSADTTKQEYGRTINHIRLFFEGKKKALLKELNKEMKQYAKELEFEKAAEIRRRIFALEHIQDVSLIGESFKKPMVPEVRTPLRIEAYDVAHLQGQDTVGVMVVVEDGEPEKNEYRKFNIKGDHGINDVASLAEILERRLGHNEWQLPKVFVVDGSTAQINAAKKVLEKYDLKIPVVGVVKDERHRPKELKGLKKLTTQYEKDILLANAESHRFALSFHRNKRRKNSLK